MTTANFSGRDGKVPRPGSRGKITTSDQPSGGFDSKLRKTIKFCNTYEIIAQGRRRRFISDSVGNRMCVCVYVRNRSATGTRHGTTGGQSFPFEIIRYNNGRHVRNSYGPVRDYSNPGIGYSLTSRT